MKKLFIISTSVISITFSLLFADDFNDFLQQQQGNFDQSNEDFREYSDEMIGAYNAYKAITEQEFNKFRDMLLKYWDNAEVSGPKKWVEYSPDLKIRRVVDFDKEIIRLDIIQAEKNKNLQKTIEKELVDLVLEDKKTAFKRDRLSQNIENRLIKDVKNLKTDRVDDTPVITKMITGKLKPSSKELDKAVSLLQKKAVVERKPSKLKNKEVVTVKIPFPPQSLHVKAQIYKPDVDQFARERGLDDALVFAVIHTESAFNPMARSHIPAYGLMQIVPKSAGLDASEFVFGQKMLLSPSYLYNSNNNINIGTAYLYIVYNRYLKKIENPESRLYCSIAAYNTGAGNVAKTFTGKKNISRASAVINKMTPDEVYEKLINDLPYSETKKYLERVTKRLKIYCHM